jgi:integrase
MGELILDQRDAKWASLKSLALKAVASPHSRRAYNAALDDFRAWHERTSEVAPLFSKAAVHSYRAALENRGLVPSSINVRLSAIRRLVAEAADNNLVDQALAAGVAHIKGVKRLGRPTGNWLNAQQAEALISAPDASTITGKRDRAIFGVLIGCGLRRSEAAALSIEHIQQREGRWTIVDIKGKGGRIRTVPMAAWGKVLIDSWTQAAGITTGHVFRPVNRGGRVTADRISNPKALWVALRKYCGTVGVPGLAPHDLRRTYAKLADLGKAPLRQIQLSLGHASIQTTELYLGTEQHLADAPCDHLGLRVTLPDPQR